MITRKSVEKLIYPFAFVEKFLNEKSDYFFTKEEIYAEVPKDEDGVPLITISQMETALRYLSRSQVIVCEYVKGVRHFGANLEEHRHY